MKVGVICNMNNNSFCITRHLRDRGYDADLLLFNCELSHFGPEADSYDDRHLAYTRQLPWGDLASFMHLSPQEIGQSLSRYDRLIGCGTAPAFVARAGRKLDLFYPYGSDLYESPFFTLKRFYEGSFWRWINLEAQVANWRYCRAQREGIRHSGGVGYRWGSGQGLALDAVLNRVCSQARRVSMDLPAIYMPMIRQSQEIQPETGELATFLDQVKAFRSGHDAVIMHTSRHIWKSEVDVFSEKANDILFRGLKEYSIRPGAKRVGILTVEYGPDVAATKQLCAELGISERVLWLPAMQRKGLLALHRHVDIVASELKNSWVSGGVLFEGMACAKPIMQRRDDALHKGTFPSLYPCMNVSGPHDVADALQAFFSDRDGWAEKGIQAQNWLIRYIINESMDRIEECIQAAAQGQTP